MGQVGQEVAPFPFAGLEPLGRWTNVAHFSVLGSSELVGRLRPTLGHTLISVARKS